MNIEYYGMTHSGARPKNEDYFCYKIHNKWALFCVADGLGGYSGGELASRIFCETIAKQIETKIKKFEQAPEKAMHQLIEETTSLLSESLKKDYPNASTTCAVTWLNYDYLVTAHVGDTRIYRFNQKNIIWQSKDHSKVQLLIDRGQLDESERLSHSESHILLQSISVKNISEPEIHLQPALKNDELILICTDGFWQTMSNQDILNYYNFRSIEENMENYMMKAIKHSGQSGDNITALLYKLKSR